MNTRHSRRIIINTEPLIEAARAIVPVLAKEADKAERERRVTDASTAAARAAGAFALGTPRRDGGIDANLTTRLRFLAELGRGCASTAWIVSTTTEAKIAMRAALSAEARADVFSDPNAVVCASARPGRAIAAAGGLRVTGTWGYASGCEHATWALLVAQLEGISHAAQPVVVLVPTTQLTVSRDWYMSGLIGTGSHSLVGEDIWVPNSHVVDMSRMARSAMNIAIAVGLFAPLLGAARGALELVANVLDERPAPGAIYSNLAEYPGAQRYFAEATHRIDSAEQRVMQIAAAVDAVGPEEELSSKERSYLRMELLSATRDCRWAFDDLMDLHGSSGFKASNPLQRFWRDFAVGSRHVQFTSYVVAEDYGRVLLRVGEAQSNVL
ncbi:acyl-CoA dehydrogenase family protein [Micromonospora chokoriensis]